MHLPNVQQLVTILAFFRGKYIPCFHILTSRKTLDNYVNIFNDINVFASKYGFNLNVNKVVMTDNEQALRNALVFVFPECQLNTCVFHLFQSVYRWYRRRISRLIFQESIQFLKFIKIMPFLPFDERKEMLYYIEFLLPFSQNKLKFYS